MIEGLSVYAYASRYFRWPKFFSAAFITFVMLNGFLLRLLCLIGLFDTVLDYRKRYWKKE